MNHDPISRTPGLRRRQVIQAGASALPVLAWGTAQGQQKFVFRMAHSEAIGAPLTLALQKWCDIPRCLYNQPQVCFVTKH